MHRQGKTQKNNITDRFNKYNPIGNEEKNAAIKVIESGVLSQFVGSWGPDFYGGKKVQEFERAAEKKFKVKYALSVNSWTSGLICAIGALGIEPGDEVILTPWTMSACSSAILHYNAIPVFVDIEENTFNIDPSKIEEKINSRTRAIMAVDIFGHSCQIDQILRIARKHNLKVITDSAQAPWSKNKNRITGTLADIGGFSLNYHKHIHTGEGGILVTNDKDLYDRMTLIRNHAESVVGPMGVTNLSNMVGFNFRFGEIEAAMALEQLKKLESLVERKRDICYNLTTGLKNLKGLITPVISEDNTHSFYIYPMKLDFSILKTTRKEIVRMLANEGLSEGIMEGYVNLHLLPMFQKKIAFGSNGFPWSLTKNGMELNYSKGICPVAEKLHEETFLGFEICLFELSDDDVKAIIEVFHKVWQKLV